MSFGPLLSQVGAADQQDVVHRLFQENYIDTVFGSGFMKQLNKLNERDGDSVQLVDMCTRFLRQSEREQDIEKSGELEKVVLQNVQKAMRGIMCLVCSMPVASKDALEDVSYLLPKNATTAPIIADLPKVGRLFVSKLRQEVC